MFLEGCGGHQPARTRSNDQHRWSTSPVTTTSSIIWRNGYIFNSNGYNLRIVGFLLSCIPLCEPYGHLPIIVISWIHIGFRTKYVQISSWKLLKVQYLFWRNQSIEIIMNLLLTRSFWVSRETNGYYFAVMVPRGINDVFCRKSITYFLGFIFYKKLSTQLSNEDGKLA